MVNVSLITNNGPQTVCVSEDSTIREVLDGNHVNYSVGSPMLDGFTLKPGDLDKTFAEYGITDSCYLNVVVKADNAAKVTVVGEAAIITSGLKLEDIKTAKKYRPDALKLFADEKKTKQVFGIDVTSRSAGMINQNGATFSETTDKDGFATITLTIDRTKGDVMKQVTDTIGMALLQLNKLEAGFGAELEAIQEDQAAIQALVEIK